MEQHTVVVRPRLNLFALPSLTTLLFALIAGVILIATLAGLAQNPVCLGPILVAGMTILPLRDLLRQPEKQLRAWGLTEAEPSPHLCP